MAVGVRVRAPLRVIVGVIEELVLGHQVQGLSLDEPDRDQVRTGWASDLSAGTADVVGRHPLLFHLPDAPPRAAGHDLRRDDRGADHVQPRRARMGQRRGQPRVC